MDTPELFPGEHEVREEAAQAGWSPSIGNGWAAVFVSPEDEGVTLTATSHASSSPRRMRLEEMICDSGSRLPKPPLIGTSPSSQRIALEMADVGGTMFLVLDHVSLSRHERARVLAIYPVGVQVVHPGRRVNRKGFACCPPRRRKAGPVPLLSSTLTADAELDLPTLKKSPLAPTPSCHPEQEGHYNGETHHEHRGPTHPHNLTDHAPTFLLLWRRSENGSVHALSR